MVEYFGEMEQKNFYYNQINWMGLSPKGRLMIDYVFKDNIRKYNSLILTPEGEFINLHVEYEYHICKDWYDIDGKIRKLLESKDKESILLGARLFFKTQKNKKKTLWQKIKKFMGL